MKSNLTTNARPLALITGASTGIGYELAILFAKEGYDLLIAADNVEIAEAAAVLRSMNTNVTPIQVDLASDEGMQEVIDTVINADRPLSALVLNAGVGAAGKFIGDYSVDKDINLMRLNMMSPVILAKALLPRMIEAQTGRVLFTSSIASLSPDPFHAVYHASKAFIQSFAEAIREELIDSGVTLTSLMPGATETQFFARADMLRTKVGQAKKDDAAEVAKQGFDAMMRGDDHVIAGSFMNKIQGVISKFTTEPMKAKQSLMQNQPVEGNEKKATDAIEMLTMQHREAESLFDRIEASDVDKEAVFKILADKLLEHMAAEEEVFYPTAATIDSDQIEHAEQEHDDAKEVIAELMTTSSEDPAFMKLVNELKTKIDHHVHEEESKVFPRCRQVFDQGDLVQLADDMRELQVDLENGESIRGAIESRTNRRQAFDQDPTRLF